MRTVTKNARLALRMTDSQKASVELAAQVLGQTVTEFAVETLTDQAATVLADQPVFSVTAAEWDQFMAALEAPAEPPQGLVDLFARPSIFMP
jgi:uncharacterized protein (DUF1778 family)